MKKEIKFTIKSLSSSREHTDTLDNLVIFVNNHPDCRARDYEIINGSNLNGINPNPTFELWLSHRGYDFHLRQAVKVKDSHLLKKNGNTYTNPFKEVA